VVTTPPCRTVGKCRGYVLTERPSSYNSRTRHRKEADPVTAATAGNQTGSRRNAPGTRRSILAAAQELFASQGYAGTSIADIAGRLGTSKAALYYHFQSKADILQALLEQPVTAWARLADSAAAGQRSAEDLLRAVIDTTAGLHTVAEVIGNDPSAQAATADLLPRSREVNQAITAALARAAPGPGSTARAHAAYAAAKNGTLVLLSATHGRLTRAARAELLAAAIRALRQPPPGQTHSQPA